jgi:3-oxoacyl-[acyl-carrier protein] reductase
MAQYLEYGIEGRAAIVTGGGTGMGAACALELAKAGAKVAIFGRRAAPIEEIAAQCARYTPGSFSLTADVSDPNSVKAGVDKVIAAFGGADILMNVAGIAESNLSIGEVPFMTKFDTMGPDEYMSFFKIHVLGHYNMCNAVVPYMQKKKYGRIVNVTSITGVNAGYASPAYTSSKAAANLQTIAYAKKYAGDNIIVNAIAPGMVNTPMKWNSPPEEFDMVAKATPLGRVPEPIEIARIAMFLAQENLFLTGQILYADGGSTMIV